MNFWYIKHYGSCFGHDIDVKMNYLKYQMVIQCINRRFDALLS